jgi:hypothetical protein
MRIILARTNRDLTFCGGSKRGCVVVVWLHAAPEMAMGYWLFVIVSTGSLPLAYAMARERQRSPRRWFWIAAIVGPLAPLALLILGDAKGSVAAR